MTPFLDADAPGALGPKPMNLLTPMDEETDLRRVFSRFPTGVTAL